MNLRFWQHWGIATRLLLIAVLPASMMFIAVAGSLYAATRGDVQRDVAERGRLIATALAQSSQYGLMSGNANYIRETLQQLIKADESITCITVTDSHRKPVADACQARGHSDEDSAFETPVQIQSLPEADLFEPPAGSPTPAMPRSATARPDTLRTVGHVRVTVSAAPIFKARRSALLVAFGLVLAAAVLSCLVGVRLARSLRQTLGSVMAALRTIRKGQFDVTLDPHRQDELGELQRIILQMATALDAGRHDLEQQVKTRTQELRHAIDQVRQADAEKRRLITHSNALVEEDRKRVAVEIHDHLGASLISVRLEAAALAAKAHATGDADMARSARRIGETVELVYASTRNIVKSLRPEVIDTLGLSMAIEEMVRGFDRVHPDCRFTFEAPGALPDLRGEFAIQAYRVTQEALNNVIKHAGASHASVTLRMTEDKARLCIEIKDDGAGFDTKASIQSGLGLIGMRERIAAVGGELSISSPLGQGTTVHAELPMPTPTHPR